MRGAFGPRSARWLLSFGGVVLLAMLIWLLGPLLSILEWGLVRAAWILLLLMVWAGGNGWIDWRRGRVEDALTAGIAGGNKGANAAGIAGGNKDANAAGGELAAMQSKLAAALSLLKKTRGSRGYLYEQPWYVLIGPPGAGKTTALMNAGLHFPLAVEMGAAALAGVGGTRLCEWWFTDNAVLIDTAGRYTTQDSDQAVDRAGWENFLDLLRRTRPRQPLNGVIVAIAVSDIVRATPAERTAHATAIRRRVREVSDRLGLRVPVYAMLTKADLLAGFTEFFDDLDRDSRGQVWGMTFAPSQDEAGLIAGFAAEFKALLTRLNDRLIGRLQTERSPPRRAAIAGFAAQVATLEQPVGEFLQAAFGGSKLDPAPFLRGVYFTSGTQEGTPIDRLTGVLTRSFGIDQRRAPSLRPEQGRSYFLTRLLRDLIFNEAMLVASSPAASRRRTLARAGAFAAIGLLTLAGMGMLWHARSTSQQAIDLAATSLAQYEPVEAAMRLDPVTDSNLPALVPVLDQSRDLPFAGQPVQHAGFDLSQNAKLQAGGDLVYRHVLERVLLPRLIWRLETQMRAGMDRPEFLYEAMRVYLMLGKAGPMDRGFIHAWMALDWQTAYPGALFAPQREGLLHHLDALLAEPLAEVPLDGDLVARARATFGRVSLASRVYSRIRDSSPAQRLPAWRPRDALGAAGSTIFIRASGKPLDDGIAGFYTPAGFHNVLLKALGDMIRNVAAENWVQGERTPFDASGAGLAAVERDVIGLYQADFVRYWDAMVADLSLQETRSLPQAAQDLYILGSNQSPMRGLLASIAQQVTLSVPPGSAVSVQGVIAKPGDDDTQKRLQSLLGTATPAAAMPGREIDERYKALRDLVGSGPGAPIDIVLKSLTDLQQQLAKMAAASASAAPAGPDPTLALRAEALRQPQPLARWLTSMANLGTMLRGSAAK